MIEYLKTASEKILHKYGEYFVGTIPRFLGTGAVDCGCHRSLEKCLNKLSPEQKSRVFKTIWDIAEIKSPKIYQEKWGRENALIDHDRLAKALHRCGFLGKEHLYPVRCLRPEFGEGGIGSQYFSLWEKHHRNPPTGHIGLVNGMGYTCIERAKQAAAGFSELFAENNNIHCVYHPTHVGSSIKVVGILEDIARMKAVDGGSYTKTSLLIAQRWIDFLEANPDKKYLQVGYSEGAVHVNAALRLVQKARPDLLKNIRILNFCPAHFILPETYEGVQVMNFIKQEDWIVNPMAKNIQFMGKSPYIKIVSHTKDKPHNYLGEDFVKVAKPHVDAFIKRGDIY